MAPTVWTTAEPPGASDRPAGALTDLRSGRLPSTQLTALEAASGIILGEVPLPFPAPERGWPLRALEAALLPALAREPCVVAFSGGRDSSLVLACAVRLARREGLPEPVCATVRFPGRRLTAETEWQELVADHVGARRREVLELGEELDLIGDAALDIRRRHGLLYPPNTHFWLPLLAIARGGTLLTGQGGDNLLLGWAGGPAAAVLALRRRPRRGDGRVLARALLPAGLRGPLATLRARRRVPDQLPGWLGAAPAAQLARAIALERARRPTRWDAGVIFRARARALAVTLASEAILAANAGVEIHAPLLDPAFVAALAESGGWLGFGDRTATMRALFGELLPDAVLARPTKAAFDDVFWGQRSREFMRDWDGEIGIPALDALIDAHAVREVWARERPDLRSALLLQAAALVRGGG